MYYTASGIITPVGGRPVHRLRADCSPLSTCADSLLASCQKNCMTYTIDVCTMKTPNDGQRNCPKHVEFCSKNKLEKLLYLVGFIIRIFNDARSPERQSEMPFLIHRMQITSHKNIHLSHKRESSPVTGLEWPRGFQEVKVPRFRDNGTGWW